MIIDSKKRLQAYMVIQQHKGKAIEGSLMDLFYQGKFDQVIEFNRDNPVQYMYQPNRKKRKELFIY